MFNGIRVIDADGHVMEPNELYDDYLEARFKADLEDLRRLHLFGLEVGEQADADAQQQQDDAALDDGEGKIAAGAGGEEV